MIFLPGTFIVADIFSPKKLKICSQKKRRFKEAPFFSKDIKVTEQPVPGCAER